MAVVLFKSQTDDPTLWKTELSRYLAHLDFRIWPDVGDPQDIEYLLIWGEPGDLLERLPNIKVILSLGESSSSWYDVVSGVLCGIELK